MAERAAEKWVLIWSLEAPWWPAAGAFPPGAPIYRWWRLGPVEVRHYFRRRLPRRREPPALPGRRI